MIHDGVGCCAKKFRRQMMFAGMLLTVLVCLAVSASAASAVVPEGAVTYRGHTYYLCKGDFLSWPAAKKACEKVGGHLVTISSAGENKLICKLTKAAKTKNNAVWIGLSSPKEDGKWQWVTREPVKYTNWVDDSSVGWKYACLFSEFHPESGWGEDENGKWDGGFSSWTLAYVCEWDFVFPASSVSAPWNVKARQTGSRKIKLTWSAGKNDKSYIIYRKAGTGAYKKIGKTSKLSFVDTKVKSGTKYQYIVEAVNGSRKASSSPVSALLMSKPASVKGSSDDQGKVTISWKKVKGATEYQIYQKAPAENGFTKVKTVSKTKATLMVDSPDGIYMYYVVPFAESFEGMKSLSTSVKVSIITYRALIIGQSYFGSNLDNAPYISGALGDYAAMEHVMLNLDLTRYDCTLSEDVTADTILFLLRDVFSQADENDVTLFYYAGHGVDDHGGSYQGALLGYDGVAIPASVLRQLLDQYKGNKLLIIDSCCSGALIGKSSSATKDRTAAGRFNASFIQAFYSSGNKGVSDLASGGYYVLTSCSGTQTCESNVFTKHLTLGLGWNKSTGSKVGLNADANKDLKVTLEEAYRYAKKGVENEYADYPSLKVDIQVYPPNCQTVFFARKP